MRRIVLAYSGDLDTTAAIPWLSDTYDAEIVTLTLDLGQSRELTEVRERALAAGAVRAHVLDLREEFVGDYILPALQAGASLDGPTPLASALACPIVAKRLVEIARMEGASAVAFGGRAGESASRIEETVRQLAPSLETIAAVQIRELSTTATIAYASERSLPLPSDEIDAEARGNLWGRSIVADVDEAGAGDDGRFTLTRAPENCPDEPATIAVEFESGVPVRTNGLEMPLLEMIESVETIAGVHGVGRIESRRLGAAHAALEAPAAVVLSAAHKTLQDLVLPRELERLAPAMTRAFEDLVQEGQWFSPARAAIAAFVSAIQTRVTGTVTVRLFKGDCRVVSVQSPNALDRVNARRAVKRLSAGR
jgi:argininosuccinate synthase